MYKSVLISIQPKWCEKILSGEKTVEVRKTKPKIPMPFKCYIYCTKGGDWLIVGKDNAATCYCGNGYVIGEFVCEEITSYWYPLAYDKTGCLSIFTKFGCLSIDEVYEYGKGKDLYCWHISKLKIYDKPKELNKFCKPCKSDCWNCEYYSCAGLTYDPFYCDWERYIESTDSIIKRPPQSWCYVNEI